MNCEKCRKEHDGSFGSGRFCSRKCANSRTHDDKTKKQISNSVQKYHDNNPRPKNWRKKVQSVESIQQQLQNCKDTWRNKLLETPYDELPYDSIKKRIKIEQNYKCNKCRLSEWLEQPIALEIDHKNGDHNDNSRDNLEALCPNCHAQTKTWRGRNKNKNKKRDVISFEQIIVAYFKTGNIRKSLLKLGLAAKGANYGRVKRALSFYNIDY